MAHIHEKYDFTVSFFVVYEKKILFIHHKILKKWLPIGGHIELDEDPDQALVREIKEECGLNAKDIKMLNKRPIGKFTGRKILYTPFSIDVHLFKNDHKHINFTYFAKSKTDKIKLSGEEHHDIKWINENEFDSPTYNLLPDIKFYA